MPGAGGGNRLAQMSPSPVWTVVGLLLAVAAATLLIRRFRQGAPASRWLAVTAVAWGAAFAAQGAGADTLTPAVQLTVTDLLAMLGLPPLGLALLRLARAGRSQTNADVDSLSRGRGFGTGRLTDGCLLALSVFIVGWIALLRHAYVATAVGPGTFAVDLIHPAADLALLGGSLWLAVQAGRRAVTPYLALCAATVGDFLAVQARATGTPPGPSAQVAWFAAIALLGAGGLLASAPASQPKALTVTAAAEPPVSTVIGLAAAGVAAAVSLIFVALTWGQNWGRSGTLLVLLGAALVLVIIARVGGLLRQAAASAALAEQAGRQFHQLADRTSDVVLLCDAAGVISYASTAVSRYGYAPDRLSGTPLLDLIHPDDLQDVIDVAAAIRSGAALASGNLACRVRAADGTWRHVQATVSRYRQAGGPDLLLVTARDISDQVALRQQVTHLTFHDGLTGLPNRSYLEERAKDVLARRRETAGRTPAADATRTGAIFLDLDGFTAINDSVGHGAGDLVLAQAGRRLRGVVPAHDTVARWGGDEFAVLIENAASPQEIVDIAERLAGAIAAEPFQVAGREMSITASLGVAFDDPELAEHLLRNADLAMSRAKDAGGGRVEVFAAHMHADVVRRLELASGLRAAIDEGSLGLEYQPVVELATSRVLSVEALVRWPPNGERVRPAEFLGIAEDSGLIVPLGASVLREACRQAAQWRESGWPVGLSVNFSLRQVSAAGFAEWVLTVLDDAGLSRSALTLEVTERVLIEIADEVMDGLATLRQLGVRLAIDDFGTGYASLAYLRQLPVDIIKIDPSFVAGLGTDGTLAMLTRTIVQVGHDLGIEIVAEGIERPEQLELLRAMGCGLGQGFLVARPMPASAIEALLGEQDHRAARDERDARDRDGRVAPDEGDARDAPEAGPAPDAAAAAPAG
jgi:diguanylate cyclase (GGDEF)-like protein/PAS domain S-box-containing protein